MRIDLATIPFNYDRDSKSYSASMEQFSFIGCALAGGTSWPLSIEAGNFVAVVKLGIIFGASGSTFRTRSRRREDLVRFFACAPGDIDRHGRAEAL